MYGIFKLTQLQYSDNELWVTIEGGRTITATASPYSFCFEFSDMLIKLGIYNNSNMTFTDNASLPKELIGNIEVEVTLNKDVTKGDIEETYVITSIELTPIGVINAKKYLNRPERVVNQFNNDKVNVIENPADQPTMYKDKPYIIGKVVEILDGDTVDLHPIEQHGIMLDTNTKVINGVPTSYISIRFLGLNTAEVPHEGVDKEVDNTQWQYKYNISADDALKLGLEGKKFTTDTLTNQQVMVYLDTYNSGNGAGKDKYGRYLGIIFLEQGNSYMNVNKTLLKRGLAEPLYLQEQNGKVMSNYPVNIWTQYSPYYHHLETVNEQKASDTAANRKANEINRDMAGLSDYSSQVRKVNTIVGYKPRYTAPSEGKIGGGETPQQLADRFGATVSEILELNGYSPDVANADMVRLKEIGWFDKALTVPVYDKPEDFYNVKVVKAGDITTPDNSYSFVPPEKDFNDIPCAETDENMKLPDLNSPYDLRIGDVEFIIPPTSIKVTETTNSNTLKTLRSKMSMKTQSGYINRILEIQLFFHSIDAINGYAIENEDVNAIDRHYYINGLRPLLAQFKKTPLVPIDNDYINQTLGIMNVGLQTIVLQTVQGFPNTVQATLQLIPFNHVPYMPQYEQLTDAINWPMFRWYYQQAMQPMIASSRQGHTFMAPVTGVENSISFALADEGTLQYRMDNINKIKNMALPSVYEDTVKNGNNEQAKLYRTIQMIKTGDQQKQRYSDFGYEQRIGSSADVTPSLAKEINTKIYKAGEPVVFIFPGHFKALDDVVIPGTSTTNGDDMPTQGSTEQTVLTGSQIQTDWDNMDQNKNNNLGSYVIRVESIDAQTAVSKYTTDSGLLKSKFKININFDGYAYIVPLNDTISLDSVRALCTPYDQDVQEYRQRYKEMETLVFGMEDTIPTVTKEIRDLTVTGIQASYSNMFSPLQTQLEQEPALQHLGGGDIVFQITCKITSEDGLSDLISIYHASQRLARSYRIAINSGFVDFDCPFAKMMGVNSVLFDTVVANTVEGQPHVYDVTITLVAFDKQQKKSELIDKTEGYDTSEITNKNNLKYPSIDSDGFEPIVIEQKMRQMELYPDLELPTFAEVNRALPYMTRGNMHAGINKIPNPTYSRFVDPDFYVAYTTTYRNSVIDAATNIGKNNEYVEFSGSGGAGAKWYVPSDTNVTSPQWDENSQQLIKNIEDATKEDENFIISMDNTTTSANPTPPELLGAPTSVQTSTNFKRNTDTSYTSGYDTVFGVSGENTRTSAFIKYLARFAPIAKSVHLLPSIMIAQAALETGWGQYCRRYNLFNIRPTNSFTQYWDGTSIKVSGNGEFRAYQSYDQSIMNYIELMSGAPRYKPVLNAANYQQAAQALMDSGYCTDFGYTSGVINIIEDYNLTQYDTVTPQSTTEPFGPATPNPGASGVPNDLLGYTPDYAYNGYLYSDEWQNSLNAGKVFSDYGDMVVNSTGDPELLFKKPYIFIENNSTGLPFEQFMSLLTVPVMGAKGKLLKATETCLEIYEIKYHNMPWPIKDRWEAKARYVEKSQFEGVLWKHYDKNHLPQVTGTGPLRTGQRNTLQGMLTDMATFDKRGRLVRAFPSFQMLLIDEGRWMTWYKMWDNFYGFNSIISIDVLKSRKMAADTAVIEMTNIYNNLTQRDVDGKYTEHDFKFWDLLKMNTAAGDKAWEILREQPTEEIINARKEAVHSLALKPGARLHLRMGYGSDAYELPIMFNGTITECNIEEQVTIVAQGDGIELSHKIAHKTSGYLSHDIKPKTTNKEGILFRTIIEPRDYMGEMMTNFGGGWSTFFSEIAHKGFRSPDDQILNISHFGQKAYLPPAAHPKAQATGKFFRFFLGPIFNTIYGPDLENMMDKVRKDGSFLTEVYGTPWDDYGEPMINVYQSAQIPSFSETYYTQAGADTKGQEHSAGADTDTKGNTFLGKLWYSFLSCFSQDYSKKGDEPNIEVYLYDRSFWDIANTYAKCVPDYICAVHPFEFRSTFFYGKPHWGLAWKYEYKYIYDEDTDEIVSLVSRAARKPYSQYRTYYSYMDIINNKIRATSDNMYTNVIVSYSANPKSGVPEGQTDIIHADTDIFPENQKTAIVSLDIKEGGFIDNHITHKTEGFARHAGVNILKDFMKDMYDGDLVVIGDPSVKPHDTFYLQDSYMDMQGNMGVKQVTFHMSYETGFITSIKPDAIVEGESRDFSSLLTLIIPTTTALSSAWVWLYHQSILWRQYLNCPKKVGLALDKLAQFILGTKDISKTGEAWKIIKQVSKILGKSGDTKAIVHEAYEVMVANADVLSEVKTAEKFATWLTRMAEGTSGKVLVGAAARKAIAASSIIEAIGVSNIITFVAFTAIDIIVSNIVEHFALELYNRQAVVLYPVKYQGLPFTAGINGSKGLVSGSEPGKWDKIFTNETAKGIYDMLGIDPPQYKN